MLALLAAIALSSSAAGAVERRDPLRPPDYRSAIADAAAPLPGAALDLDAWTLTSTLVSPQRRVAIINGLAVRTGERVAGARVLGIEPGLVRLEIDGRPFTVRRAPTNLRRTPRGQKR
jgi:MSHA biogenesis protein MshK